MSDTQLELSGVSVDLGGRRVVDDISFSIAEGDIACLLGPSGCGKTTVLRTIAGFQAPSAGNISIAGTDVADARRQSPPEHRRVGMVFQDLALFPHMSVRENIGFGMRAGHWH